MPSTVITRKGQVTIPAAFRRALQLAEGDRLTVLLDGTSIRLVPAGSVVERTAGVLPATAPALSAEALRTAAEEAIAREALERSGT